MLVGTVYLGPFMGLFDLMNSLYLRVGLHNTVLLVAGFCTLIVTFGILHQTVEGLRGPANGIFLLFECRLSGGDTQPLPAVM